MQKQVQRKVYLTGKDFYVPDNNLSEAIRRWERARGAIASVYGCKFYVREDATWLPFYGELDNLLSISPKNDKYPHTCVCGAPAYIGAYALDCSARCDRKKQA